MLTGKDPSFPIQVYSLLTICYYSMRFYYYCSQVRSIPCAILRKFNKNSLLYFKLT